MVGRLLPLLLLSFLAAGAQAQPWDSIRGAKADVGDYGPHWFVARGRHIGYVVDGDSGEVQGTMTLSMFTPAVEPHLEADRIYAYGSFYSRTYYGERTDALVFYDKTTLEPASEVIIPAKSAGIGHSGMIGLIEGRYVGVWNITPAMSVSIVDVEAGEFVDEISTPGCAGVYPVGSGFLMPCGDGALMYVALDDSGEETGRMRSRSFFSVEEDPVYDYAVPTAEGWLFVSFEGQVYEATVSGDSIVVSEPWSIFGEDGEDGDWRIGGRQPFAYNAETDVLVTLMHEGGGQETFEDAGTEVWAFDRSRGSRGYRLALEKPARSLGVTHDAEPLLLIAHSEDELLSIHDLRTGGQKRQMEQMGVSLLQPLLGPDDTAGAPAAATGP